MTIPDNWTPTAANINALPKPLRDYIMRLSTDEKRAGLIAKVQILEGQVKAMNRMLEERQWQPIETAPCDDTDALVYFSRFGAPVIDVCNLDHDSDPQWWRDRGATHWMPLPEPPDV